MRGNLMANCHQWRDTPDFHAACPPSPDYPRTCGGIGEELRRVRENCTLARRRECEKGCGPALEAVCATCERREPHVPFPWFGHIWFLYGFREPDIRSPRTICP
jgi:hypothetical protein